MTEDGWDTLPCGDSAALNAWLDEREIDPSCALASLRRWLEDDDAVRPRELLMPAVLHFDCGHQRPTNLRLKPGETWTCVACDQTRSVVRVEIFDEPRWFPAIDALADLPVTS